MVNLSVVGLGYVGLPLALAFDAAGYDVVGFDLDRRKVVSFRGGLDPTGEVGVDAIRGSDITFTDDPADIRGSDFYLITVPTPIDAEGQPDLSYVESAGETVGAALTHGSTVALESTVYPGATREVRIPALERESGLVAGVDFHVGYSPERIVPGTTGKALTDIVKIVSGHDEVALERLAALYGEVVEAGIYRASSLETAEAAKCLENTQRDVNIALMNEFAMGCRALDPPLDPREVIDAAATKWNFHDYRPGLVGGHCIPVDPNYLIWKLEQGGADTGLMRAAREANDSVATYIATVTTDVLAERLRVREEQLAGVRANGGQVLSTATDTRPRLLVLGFAYKPGVTDTRSPVLKAAIGQLRETVDMVGVDPHVPAEAIREGFGVPAQETFSVAGFDGLLLATAHEEFASLDLAALAAGMNDHPVLVDMTGTYDREAAVEGGFIHRGL